MHAWDEPAETLLELGAPRGSQLLMPRLGEAVEPRHAERVQPWWRGVDAGEKVPVPQPVEEEAAAPVAVPWPLD
jgi:hypothetical protein